MSGTGYTAVLTTIAAAGLCAILQPAAAQKPPAATKNAPAFPQELPEPFAEVPEYQEVPGVTAPTTMRQAQPEPTIRFPTELQEGIEADLPRPEPQARAGLRDAAASKTTVSGDAMRSANVQSTDEALRNVPSVASTDTRGGGGADSLQIRGIKLNSTTSYRLDGGLPFVNNIVQILDDKERVEALKGAGALQFGLASAGGTVNYIMKRAGNQPNLSLGTQVNIYGQALATIDAGARFGPDQQLGLRFVGGGGEFGSFVYHSPNRRAFAGLAADWQPSDRVSFLFDWEHFNIDLVEQGALQLNPACPLSGAAPRGVLCPAGSAGRIILPGVPDPRPLRSGQWAYSTGYLDNVLGRARVALGSGFEVVSDLGRSVGYRPERDPTQISNYNVITGLGTATTTLVRQQEYVNDYANIELHHVHSWSWLDNLAVLGSTYNRRDFNNPQNPTSVFPQNIYDPFAIPAPLTTSLRRHLADNSYDADAFFRDQIDVFKRVHVFAGVRRIYYNATAAEPDGSSRKTDTTFNAPGAGVVVDIIPPLSFYASYVRSLDETGQAPVSAANAYEVLPPAPATQKEIGIKLNKIYGTDTTLGYFWINRGNATTDTVTNIYSLNGTTTYEGIESTTVVPVGHGVTLNGGGTFMHATQYSKDITINGKAPENIPVWSGTGGITWRPSQLPGLRLNVGFLAVAPREANPQNQAKLPGYGIFNAGASYTTTLFGKRTSFNLTASNILNNRYWSTVSSGQLGISTPLTVAFSARTELF